MEKSYDFTELSGYEGVAGIGNDIAVVGQNLGVVQEFYVHANISFDIE